MLDGITTAIDKNGIRTILHPDGRVDEDISEVVNRANAELNASERIIVVRRDDVSFYINAINHKYLGTIKNDDFGKMLATTLPNREAAPHTGLVALVPEGQTMVYCRKTQTVTIPGSNAVLYVIGINGKLTHMPIHEIKMPLVMDHQNFTRRRGINAPHQKLFIGEEAKRYFEEAKRSYHDPPDYFALLKEALQPRVIPGSN